MTSRYRYIPIAGGGGGEEPVLETLNVTDNGQYLPGQGVTGYNQVNVNVPASAVDSGTLQQSISQNGTQTINVVGYANIELDVQVAGGADPNYFWIENVDENDLQTLVQLGNDSTSYSNKEIYYSQDKTNWTRMSQAITIGAGDKVYFYGNNLQINNEGFKITGGDVNIGGDATCLLTRQGGQKYGYEYVFYHLFGSCTAIKSADDLIIPFVTIGQWGMNGMFAGCTGLEHARFAVNIINATSLCFGGMFINCTSLIDSPTFTCQSASDRSFQYTFQNCRSLTSAPDLNTITTLSSGSQFESMFNGCTSLTTIPLMPNTTTLAGSCYSSMFQGCTSLTAIPSGLLPATTLASRCYQNMFYGCTSLTTIPSGLLPAATLKEYCYYSMFRGCTSLTTIPSGLLPATTLANQCYQDMFQGCTSLTTVPVNLLPATTGPTCCYQEMFSDCVNLTTAPDVVCTTYTGDQNCYRMFKNCSSLVTAPSVNINIPNINNWRTAEEMFYGCTSLVDASAVTITSTIVGRLSFVNMFKNCSSLVHAPIIPNITQGDPGTQGFSDMFNGCSQLSEITCLIESLDNISSGNPFPNWVNGVSATGTFYKAAAATFWTTGNSGIPSGWTVVDYVA